MAFIVENAAPAVIFTVAFGVPCFRAVYLFLRWRYPA